ncbi:MAG: Type 1 glutamine amidotransferase-like domain-containing protein [Bacilli bacterium]|nr:Type 1 glutamine amidotransferase-like domain-containing protein [Bacilli bacterium]
MKKLMLIGGGDTGRGTTSYETKEIDEEIVKMTEKEKPNFLFIGLASSHSDSYYDTMKKIYKDLNCETVYLKKKNIINNPDIVVNKIENADIIYICGGDTVKLINDIKEYKIDKLLLNAYNKGTVLAGMSAGAILLSNKGFSDSLIVRGESNKHEFIKGLNFVNLNFCPHYHSNPTKTKELEEYLSKHNEEVYSLENCTALKIVDNKISIIKSNKNSKAFLVSYKDKLIEKEI